MKIIAKWGGTSTAEFFIGGNGPNALLWGKSGKKGAKLGFGLLVAKWKVFVKQLGLLHYSY